MKQVTPENRHQREVRNQIVLPMLAALLFMAALIVLAIAALSPGRFSMVADLMSIGFLIVPIVLTCLLPTILMMAIALGMVKLTDISAPPLAKLRSTIIGLLEQTRRQIPRAATPVIMMQERLNRLEHLVGAGRPAAKTEEEQTHGD